MARIERLRQNTPEWDQWRLQGIGSSDASVLMGDTAFKTPRMLWLIKTQRRGDNGDSPAARRGRELERLARRVYEQRIGIQMEPACLVHQEHDWMRASLDGISFDGDIVLEIKCPWNLRAHQALRSGRVPPWHYAQLQHQLEVSRAKEAHYWSFDGAAGTLVKVSPDQEYIGRLIEAEREFWLRVVENRWPDHSDDELDLSDDQQWCLAAALYRQARIKLDEATVEEQQARERLKEMASAQRTFGGRVEVLRSFRRGIVDYSRIPQLRGVDLELYRKAPVEVVKINLLHSQGALE